LEEKVRENEISWQKESNSNEGLRIKISQIIGECPIYTMIWVINTQMTNQS
jgi:hypothetical protein